MSLNIYNFTDPGAPVLTGAQGKLIEVLDACLVNGYGTKLPAGWTKPFSGTNIAVYQQGAGGIGCYLRVDDSIAPATPNISYFRGFVNMSGVSTGTDPFPTTSQLSNGCVVVKAPDSNTTTPREWTVFATSNYFYLITQSNVGNISAFFGNFEKYYSNDVFNCAVIGYSPSNNGFGLNYIDAPNATSSSCPRFAAGSITSNFTPSATHLTGFNLATSSMFGFNDAKNIHTGAGTLNYPNPVDGLVYISPFVLMENGSFRGVMPRMYGSAHNNTNFSHMQMIAGTGAYASKTFIYIKHSTQHGGYFLEI